jgi:hypothetical protein
MQELDGAQEVLQAPALTHVADLPQAVANPIYYIFLALGRRRDE